MKKILGNGFEILPSMGHVRDLPKGRLGVDIEHDFAPEYIQVRGKADIIKKLKAAYASSQNAYLASDPDREGEAIAWHLADILGIDPTSKCRVKMYEITPSGVKKAFSEPEIIDMDRVDAQQARRLLDRLLGYQLSPLLWRKIQKGLSAGRVQSVALRILCEREDEIEAFKSQEYWLIEVEVASEDNRRYRLRLEKRDGKSLVIENEAQAQKIESELKNLPFIVESFKTRETARDPMPPFRTSTLQQEASRRLGFAPRRTMRIAQSLYEGVEIPGRGPTGLITYMRTDSVRLSSEAVTAAREYIRKTFGEEYLPSKPKVYVAMERTQDAHEAIRPTDVFLDPESLKDHLTSEQYRLYDLIWRRFVACQMAQARVARATLEVAAGPYSLKQSGAAVRFEGWGRLWPLGVKDALIPEAVLGERFSLVSVDHEQKFTQPPARYTEAGLIKVLEEKGIGRPSTYATIVETLLDRGYVENEETERKLHPTRLGRIVNTFLVKYFPGIINVDFTAKLEGELDEVESGKVKWLELVKDFWEHFHPTLEEVSEKAERVVVEPVFTGEVCPECGRPLVIKRGRFGEFIACSGYPECKFTQKMLKSTGIPCPKCGKGELVRRKAGKGKAKGRIFYGCSRYPECDFLSWKKPTGKKCPQCGAFLVVGGKGKPDVCPQCGYVAEEMEVVDAASE